jgi:hypothetical protein
MRQTTIDEVIKFCKTMINQDLNSHRGAYANVIKFCNECGKKTEKDIITEAYSQGRIDEETRFPYAIDGEDYYKLEFTQSSE